MHEYGRQGQRQFGVDVYGEMLDGRKLGIQCKEMKKGAKLKELAIKIETDLAISFRPNLDVFIIAST